jgi:hypothetical protein
MLVSYLQWNCIKSSVLSGSKSDRQAFMAIRRLTAGVLLACYGLIALWGQGLHALVDDDDGNCCELPTQIVAAGGLAETIGSLQCASFIHAGSGLHEHDCDNCPICQFHAAGQHFVAPAPTQFELSACEILSPPATESVHCPALFSPAQPRAPPAAA